MSDFRAADSGGSRSRWPWIIGMACLVLLFIVVLRRGGRLTEQSTESTVGERASAAANSSGSRHQSWVRSGASGKRELTAEEIVSSKVRQFARSRREFVYALARRANKEVPNEVE